MPQRNLQAKDLLKTSGIIKSDPQETLFQALAKLRSSRDAVFTFDERGRFLGVVSPYYVLFKRKFPAETKVKNCLFSPPRLQLSTPIWDIARLMLEAKIYFLPVFDQRQDFAGIVSVKRMLEKIKQDKNLSKKLLLKTKKNIVTISQKTTLGQAFSLMKEKRVSRIPVVNYHNHLVGIVTRFDLRLALSAPVDSQRFLSRVGDKRKYLNKPIENFYQKMVVTVSLQASIDTILDKLLTKDIGSVVVINNKQEPVGIVSSHDVLEAIYQLKPEEEPQIEVKFEGDFAFQAQAKEIFFKFIDKVKKLYPINTGEFILTILENRAGLPSRYKTRIHLSLKRGRQLASKVVGYNWRQTLRETVKKVKRQLER